MMVKGFDDDVEWSDVKRVGVDKSTKRREEIQLESWMHHQLFPISLCSLSIYLLYVDSLEVPSLSPRIKPDPLLRRNRGLMMLVLVLHFAKDKRGGKWREKGWIKGTKRGIMIRKHSSVGVRLTRDSRISRTCFSHNAAWHSVKTSPVRSMQINDSTREQSPKTCPEAADKSLTTQKRRLTVIDSLLILRVVRPRHR